MGTARYRVGEGAERWLQDQINGRPGWICRPFGPESNDPIREALAKVTTAGYLRQTPDLIATNSDLAWLIEVKVHDEQHRTAWAIEQRSLEASHKAHFALGWPIVYAFVNEADPYKLETLVSVDQLWDCPRRPGPSTGNGSGKPYWIVTNPWPDSPATLETVFV
jgi:hypothetical protein